MKSKYSNRLIELVASLLLLGFSLNLSAHADGNGVIVSTKWLSAHLNDPDLVILEIGENDKFEKEHIPGAHFISLDMISTPRRSGLSLEIPSLSKLDSTFQNLGVNQNSKVVLYYGLDWVSPTTRVFFTLDYLGFRNQTSILDGGLPAWKKDGFKTTSEITVIKPGNIHGKPQDNFVVKADWLKENLNNPNVAVVDGRETELYTGEDNTWTKPDGTVMTFYDRPGHITGAISIPFTDFTTDSIPHYFKSQKELESIFSENGISKDQYVINYCMVGQKATVNFFVAKLLGYKTSLYDGSYQEWDKRKDLPVTGMVVQDQKK